MSDLTVAKTILEQLGGSHFKVMTGARAFLGGDNWLMFNLPPCDFKLNDIDLVKITLEPSDTYTVEFLSGEKHVETVEDVYCDQLRDLFERVTGLLTSLTPRRGVHHFG